MRNVCVFRPFTPEDSGIVRWAEIMFPAGQKCDHLWFVDISSIKDRSKKRNLLEKYFLPFFNVRSYLRRVKSIQKTNPLEVVHLCTSGGLGFYRDLRIAKWAKKKRIKVILHLHFGRMPEIISRKKGMEYWLFSRLKKRVSAFIAMDEKTHTCLSKNAMNVFYLPNPAPAIENCYNFTSKEIIFVGAVRRPKGVFELLNAFKEIKCHHPDWRMTMVGSVDPEVASFVSRRPDFADGVVFEGRLPHDIVLEKMKNAAILVLPSYTEGMPNVVLEAMACSVPVIGSRVGCIPSMIENDRILVNPMDVRDLTDKLSFLIENDDFRKTISETLFEKAQSEFGRETLFEKLTSIWDWSCGGSV